MMQSPSVLCRQAQYVAAMFDAAARLQRDAEPPEPEFLLQQIEEEEARFHIWAESLGILKLDSAFPAKYFDVNKDVGEEIARLLCEVTGYLNELNHRKDEVPARSDGSDTPRDDRDSGEDEAAFFTEECDEPDDFAVASMLLIAIYDTLIILSRIATSIHKTGGHFDEKPMYANKKPDPVFSGRLTALAEEDRTIIPRSQTTRRLITKLPSYTASSSPFSSVRFWVSWKHITIHHQTEDRPSYYRYTTLGTPPVTTAGFEVVKQSPIFQWTPGLLIPTPPAQEETLRIHGTSSLVWCPDHRTYLVVPFDCTKINVSDRVEANEEDNWDRLKLIHESFHGNPLNVISHHYPDIVLAGPGPSESLRELIPHGGPASHAYSSDTSGTPLLAGDLSLLLGLAALSTTPDQTKNVIESSFWPRWDTSGWIPYGKSLQHRTTEVGIVVTIFDDYPKTVIGKTVLQQWESGELGPILT